jgi:hypothetical protein
VAGNDDANNVSKGGKHVMDMFDEDWSPIWGFSMMSDGFNLATSLGSMMGSAVARDGHEGLPEVHLRENMYVYICA